MCPFRFSTAPALLGGISALVPGDKSALSPLRIPDPVELTPDQRAQLTTDGWLQDGRLVEEARQMLTMLSGARAFTHLRLHTPGGLLDEAVYFGIDPAQTVQLSTTAGGLQFSSPAEVEDLLARVAETTGSSDHPGSPWSEELPPLEGLALAALMDLRRKAVIRALLDNQPVTPPPSDAQSIAGAIQELLGNAQWFTAGLFNVCGLTSAPPPVQVQAALDSLDGKGRVWKQDANYYPLPAAIAAADRFLIPSVLLTLDLGHANSQGKAAFVREAWLQAGVGEGLHVSQSMNLVRMEILSPAAMLQKIRYAMTQIEAQPAPPAEMVQLAVAIQSGVDAGQTFPLVEETVLGRGEGSNIHILDARASRRHTLIQKSEQGYQVSDAGSTNGTYLNGQLLTGPAWLKEGDVIAIGDTRILVIRAGATPPPVESQPTLYAGEAPRSLPSMDPAALPDPLVETPDLPVPAAPVEQPAPPVETRVQPEPPAPVLVNSVLPEPVPPALPLEPAPSEPRLNLCPHCGSETASQARFCGTCGFRLND